MNFKFRHVFFALALSVCGLPLQAQQSIQDTARCEAEEMFHHAPYLQNPADDGITVMIQTRPMAHCWVEYGTDTLHLQKARTLIGGQAVCHDIEHKIRLSNLEKGETYYYRVCAQEITECKAYHKTFGKTGITPFYKFTLPSAGNGDFTALILNDLHDYRETIAALGKLAAGMNYDFVIFNGDCLSEPADREHAIHLIGDLTETFGGSEVPIFFIRGNHEIRNSYSSGMPSLLDNPGGNTYGAFNWGNTRFVFLDCGEDKPDDVWVYYGLNDFTRFRQEQLEFLKQEARNPAFKKAERRILVNHIPIWGNTDEYQPCTELWGPFLKTMDFDFNFAAHVHRYKFYPKGSIGNPFPVLIGGGPELEQSRLLVLTKKGKEMKVKVLDAQGREVDAIEL